MLQNGTGTNKGGDNRSRQQQLHQYQVEDCPTFSSKHMKPRGSSSSLTSAKPMTTKVSAALENDLQGTTSSHIQNSVLQQSTSENKIIQQFHFRQFRPSVLRKGNEPFPQAVALESSVHNWVMAAVCKTEPESDLSGLTSSHTGQSDSRLRASPQPTSPEHDKHSYTIPEGFLCVKGQCRWPGCSRSKEVFKEYAHFLRHLSTEHAFGEQSVAQFRMQKDKVQHMENQLTAERQKLQAMQLHLFDVRFTSEGGNGVVKVNHQSTCQSMNGLCDSSRVAADALTQRYWQISTSPVIPGIIPSFEYYKYTNIRPPFTYASMIRWAILDSSEKQLTLNEIYHWFTRMFFYFRHNTATWKNAVRHNLSLHKCFVRVEGRKGSVWTVDEEEFLRRKGQKLHRDQEMSWMPPFHLFPLTPQGESYQM